MMKKMEKAIISGIAFSKDEAQLTIRGVPDQPGIASLILGPIAEHNIDVDMIVQNVGADGLANFTLLFQEMILKKEKNYWKKVLKN